MLIFSQDKNQIMDCKTLSVTKNYGGKKEDKFAIVGSAGIATELNGNRILASFPDEKTALDTLEKIFTAFENGAKSYRL